MANNHKSKLAEAEAKEKALQESDSMSDASVVDLGKAAVAKVTNSIADWKEKHVSSDPKTRKEQEYIRKVDKANLMSEAEATCAAVGQVARKGGVVVYGAAKGLVRGFFGGGSKPKAKSSKDGKSKASNS